MDKHGNSNDATRRIEAAIWESGWELGRQAGIEEVAKIFAREKNFYSAWIKDWDQGHGSEFQQGCIYAVEYLEKAFTDASRAISLSIFWPKPTEAMIITVAKDAYQSEYGGTWETAAPEYKKRFMDCARAVIAALPAPVQEQKT